MAKKVERKNVAVEVKEGEFDYRQMFSFNRAGHDSDDMQKSKPKYTQILNGEVTIVKAKVVLMKCDVYLKNAFNVPYPACLDHSHGGYVINPARAYSLPVINLEEKVSLGWEKALVMLRNGIDKLPVLVVAKTVGQVDEFIKQVGGKEYKING